MVVVKSFLETDPLSVNCIANTFYINKHSLAGSVQSLVTVSLSGFLGKHSECCRLLPITGHYLLLDQPDMAKSQHSKN